MMTVELTYLAYTIALFFLTVFAQASIGVRQHGGPKLMRNRDDLDAPAVVTARAKRAVDNFRENLWFFVPLILVAAIADISNQWTVLGAQAFFWSRLGYSISYILGWPYIRPLFWLAGVIACVLIFLALFGVLV
ncbi:MAG: MAPEG family protein [Hyphomonadaceae bacterium]|nr:MAPEG family protein [Hyphomonadaceae bacterium]